MSTPAARLLLPLLVAAVAVPAHAARPAMGVEVSAAAGAYLPVGTSLLGSAGISLEAVVPLTPQIAVGVLGATSSHGTPGSLAQVSLDTASLVGEWRLDVGRFVPVLRVGVGALRVGAPDGSSSDYPSYELGLALDWWTTAPHRGFAVGGEVRYLGLLTAGQAFPVVACYAFRVSYAF